tara:strand:- start:60 stop:575 length:516 start_codon:yes stop_codon:yes gene_type:complete
MKKIILLLLFIPLVSFGQSKKVKKIAKKMEFKIRSFDSSQPIMVDRLDNDTTNLSGEFENSLFMEGYEVISNRVAKEIVEFNNPLNQKNESIRVEKYNEVKAVYVLTVSGTVRADTGCGGFVPSRITGRIVDMLNDGKLVGTFRFSQGGFEGKCASDIAEAVAFKLRSLSP